MTDNSTMKAAQAKHYGDAGSVLDINYFSARPHMTDGQCLIKVMSAAINPADWKLLKGHFKLIVKTNFPYIPGMDVCGIVEACGKNVKKFKVGDAVFGDIGTDGGAFAEYVAVDENLLALKPESLNFAEAACLPFSGLTAYQALHVHAKIEKGQKILIIGACGGVGHLACQMAKLAGLHVVGVCPADSVSFVESLGVCHKVINYEIENWSDILKGQEYNVIIDTVGGYQQWAQADCNGLSKGGIFVTTVGDDPNEPLTVGELATDAAHVLTRKFKSLFGEHHRYEIMTKYNNKPEELDAIRKMCESGKLKAMIDSTYNMTKESVIQMFQHCQAGFTKGKSCLLVRPEANSTYTTHQAAQAFKDTVTAPVTVAPKTDECKQ